MSHDHPATAADPAWPVLLATGDADCVGRVLQALACLPVPLTLRVAAGAMPALRQALNEPVRLVVVDWALDGPSGQALVRQLARLRPALPVLAFDTTGVVGAADRMLAWPWSDLTIVLGHWLLQASRPEHGAALRSSP